MFSHRMCPLGGEMIDAETRAQFALLGMVTMLAHDWPPRLRRMFAAVCFVAWVAIPFIGCAAMAEAYELAVTFDTVAGAEAYVVTANETRTVIAAGGDPYSPTTVYVEAVGQGTISAPSNTLTVPAQATECQRMDLDDDGLVTSSDVLQIMLSVQDGVCP